MEGRVESLVFTHDEKFLISGSRDLSIKVWNLSEKRCVHSFELAHNSKYYFLLAYFRQ